jgi:lysozyme family protein
VADFKLAIDYVLANEGGLVEDPADPGGVTNYGIAQKDFPHLDIRGLTLDQAKEIYLQQYWQFDDLARQPVATKLLDMAVNLGPVTAIYLLQLAAGVPVDGKLGPGTLKVVNGWCPRKMLAEMAVRSAVRRVELIQKNPALEKFALGWLRRDIKCPPVAAEDES